MRCRHRVAMLLLAVLVVVPGHADETTDEAVILLPVFTEVVGAYDSFFTTHLEIFNSGSEAQHIQGIRQACGILCPPEEERQVDVEPRQASSFFSLDGNPGQIIRVSDASDLHFDLRAQDLSRNGLSAGTNIPVVSTDEFFSTSIFISMRSTPVELFRNTLRVYALDSTSVMVRFWREAPVGGVVLQSETTLLLQPGILDNHPSYAELNQSGFPGPSEVFPATGLLIIEIMPLGEQAIWAFVSTTNNSSQEITIATPGSLRTNAERREP